MTTLTKSLVLRMTVNTRGQYEASLDCGHWRTVSKGTFKTWRDRGQPAVMECGRCRMSQRRRAA